MAHRQMLRGHNRSQLCNDRAFTMQKGLALSTPTALAVKDKAPLPKNGLFRGLACDPPVGISVALACTKYDEELITQGKCLRSLIKTRAVCSGMYSTDAYQCCFAQSRQHISKISYTLK